MGVAKIDGGIVTQIDRTTDEAPEGWVECGEDVACGMTWNGAVFGTPNHPQGVPQIVTRFQAKAALALAGKLAAAQALVDASTDPMVPLAWNEVASFERNSPMLNAMAAALWPENTDAELDAVFTVAAGITA